MIRPLSWDLWFSTQAHSHRRLPKLERGPEHDLGGRQYGSKPFCDWIILGTQDQLHRWGEWLLDLVPQEMLDFKDTDPWDAQQAGQLKRWHAFFRPASDWPAFLWVTPFMPVVGRTFAQKQNKPIEDIKLVAEISDSQRTLKLDDWGSVLDLRSLKFAPPPDREAKPRLVVIDRTRKLGVTIMSLERMIYSADSRAHADKIKRAWTPANEPFYESDQEDPSTGWVRTAHLTPVKLAPRGKDYYRATAYYLGLRFDRYEGWSTSAMDGREDFDQFVGHHPFLLNLLQTYASV